MWRHLYTWSSDGPLGAAGWQTVAASGGLDAGSRAALEDLASRLRTEEVARPDAPRNRRRHHVTGLASRVGRTVLTRIEPLGRTGDGRPGNAWIESVVVPDDWLATSGWDTAAAFEAVRFLGPEAGASRAGEELPDESPPPLRAGSADRIRRLPELAPDPDIRRALMEALVRQARLDRETGRSEATYPIYVVEAPGAAPGELEELIHLLPLALPPEDRERGAGDHRRSLRLATYAVPGVGPEPDLMGVPERYLEEARGGRGWLIDLGGAIPPPRSDDPADRRAADMIERRLTDPFPPGATMPDRSSPSSSADPLAEREALWEAREVAEGEAGTLLHTFRRDLEQLLTPVREQVERAEHDAAERSAELAKDFERELEKERRLIDQYKDKALRELADEAEAVRSRIQRELTTARQELERLRDDTLDQLDAEGRRSQRNVKAVATGEEVEDAPVRPRASSKESSRGGSQRRASAWERLLGSKSALWTAIGVIVLALLGLGWWLLQRGDGADEATLPDPPATMQPRQTGEPLTRLTDRLAEPAEASRLLEAAARPETLRDPAAVAYLRIAHGPGRALSLEVSCALLQTVLGVGVDGSCGAGTQRALATRVADGPCAVNGWQAQGACVLDEAVGGDQRTEPCMPSWPFDRDCSWQRTEARELLDLVRKAAVAAPEGPVRRDRLDLAVNGALAAELGAVESVPPDVVQDLAFLAYQAERLAAGRAADAERRPGTLSAEQVERVEAYLDGLRADGGSRTPPA